MAPDGDVAGIPDILKKHSRPPEKLVKEAEPQIDALRKVADLKKGMTRTMQQ